MHVHTACKCARQTSTLGRHPRRTRCVVHACRRPCTCTYAGAGAYLCACACTWARARACTSACAWTSARAGAHAHGHAHAHAFLLHDRCRRAASARRTWQPPTRAATRTLSSRQHPHARSCVHTRDCRLPRTFSDAVVPHPRPGWKRPGVTHVRMWMCIRLVGVFVATASAATFALTSQRPWQGALPLEPTASAKSATGTSTPTAGKLTDALRTPVCMLYALITRCTPDRCIHQMPITGWAWLSTQTCSCACFAPASVYMCTGLQIHACL